MQVRTAPHLHAPAVTLFRAALSRAIWSRATLPSATLSGAVLSCAALAVPAASHAQAGGAAQAAGATVYQAKCSLCHDSGAGAAPRLTHPEEWTARLSQTRAALHNAAVQGKQGTAMAPKGGYAELAESDVKAAVDFMLARLGYKEGAAMAAAPAGAAAAVPAANAAASATSPAPVDDAAITEKIRAAYAASNGAVSTRVQVESSGGAVTLRGMVRDNQALKRAEDLARAVPGVKKVDNKLVSAAVFQWD